MTVLTGCVLVFMWALDEENKRPYVLPIGIMLILLGLPK
jgi:hypothetical protein